MREVDIYTRQLRLERLGYADYTAYIKGAHWRGVRARYRNSDLPQDCMCGTDEYTVLHHTTYKTLGEEALTDLLPLCAECHAMVHSLETHGLIGLDVQGLESEERVAAYAKLIAEAKMRRKLQTLLDMERRVQQHWLIRLRDVKREAWERRYDIHSEIRLVRYLVSKGREAQVIDIVERLEKQLDKRSAARREAQDLWEAKRAA